MKNDVVIIGAGHAGGMTAISLNQNKFRGSITLIGEEDYLPYQRPALSKGFLAGEIEEKRLYLKSQNYFDKHNIKVIQNHRAVNIDRRNKTVLVDDGKKINYEKLIIATGSRVNKINTTIGGEGLNYLRTIRDSLKIQESLKNKNSITIIGAGYIGLEIASVAAKKGLSVDILEYEKRVMSRAVSPEISDFLKLKHESLGVDFKFKASVIKIQNHHNGYRIFCGDNSKIDTDFVVIGVGIQPNVKIAKSANLECNNGIIVDHNGQTSDPNIFAVGDCTNHPNAILGQRLRLESVHNAVEQAKSTGAFIAGKSKPYNQVPWFWSDQYNIKLQIAGISTKQDKRIIRGCFKQEKCSVFSLSRKRIVAVEAINNQKDFMLGKKLIEQKAEIKSEFLEDTNSNLGKFIQ